jgi:gamma-glutamyl phosphate reductase
VSLRGMGGSRLDPHMNRTTSHINDDDTAPPLQQIMAANEKDLANARDSKLGGPLLKRLALSEAKIKTLADGITALADVSAGVVDSRGGKERRGEEVI